VSTDGIDRSAGPAASRRWGDWWWPQSMTTS